MTFYSQDDCDPACHQLRRDQAETFRWVTLGIGSGFLALSVINYILFRRYRQKEMTEDSVAADIRVREVDYR